MKDTQKPKITVIGIGNTLMGDDGAGIVVARSLLAHEFPGVEVVIGETAGMALIKYFRTSGVVIVIDALAVGAEPGAIFRFDPDAAGIMSLRSNNIHGMGVPYLVSSARMLGVNPEVVVYGIQVGDVHPRDGVLTPEVASAVKRVRELVVEELELRLTMVDI